MMSTHNVYPVYQLPVTVDIDPAIRAAAALLSYESLRPIQKEATNILAGSDNMQHIDRFVSLARALKQ